MRCPVCGKGELKRGKIKESMFGVYLGEFPAQICSECCESFTDSDTMHQIEVKAKEKGIWGLGKRTKITRTGNSLAVRIPQEIANFLGLKESEEVFIHPEEKKLVVEAK